MTNTLQRISLSYQQAPEPIENENRQSGSVPIAEMQHKSSRPTTKPIEKRSAFPALPRNSPFAEGTVERETPGASKRKRKDVTDDGGDGEYTPSKPSKKQKPAPEDLNHMSLDQPKATDQSAGDTNHGSYVTGTSGLQRDASPSGSRVKQPGKVPRAAPRKDALYPAGELSEDDFGDDTLVNDFVGYHQPNTLATTERRRAETPPVSPTDTLPLERNGESESRNVPSIEQPHPSNPVLSRPPFVRPSEPTPSPGLRSAIKIRYYIITSRHPRLSKIRLPDCSLKDKSIDALFDEVSALASRTRTDCMDLILSSDRTEFRVRVKRDQSEVYEDMKGDFSQEIKDGAKMGIREFELWMEPSSTEPDIVQVDERMDTGPDDDDFSFSI